MSPIVEFIYYWALFKPEKVTLRNSDGTYSYAYTDYGLKGAIFDNGIEEWKLGSGRRISTKEVNEFLRKYII